MTENLTAPPSAPASRLSNISDLSYAPDVQTTLDGPKYSQQIGALIRAARQNQGLTQSQLAERLGTSQSAVHRMEQGNQNLSLELLSRVSTALDSELISIGHTRRSHLRVYGGHRLTGSIEVNSSKNGAVALLCASLLNHGTTRLRSVARILEVERLVTVLRSIGVKAEWMEGGSDLEIQVPDELDMSGIDAEAARRTRSILMFLGPLLSRMDSFELPYAGGCHLGTRTIQPHLIALRPYGVEVDTAQGSYHVKQREGINGDLSFVLTERGDTVTENAIMAAVCHDGISTIRNASPNYMVQDLCYFLTGLGVQIEGIGTTTLRVHGRQRIEADVDYVLSEDPVEAMTLLTAGIITGSQITVERVPIEFMEIELAILGEMGLRSKITEEYVGRNGHTRLVDVTVFPSDLHAPIDTVHPMPFPGLNIDNLPFFAVIGACASGHTLIHDWVYDNRAIYLTELTRLGADVRLLDPHRLDVTGPTRWSGSEIVCPPALRPAVVTLLAMLACKGTSELRGVEIISRGHDQLTERLVTMGARIEAFTD